MSRANPVVRSTSHCDVFTKCPNFGGWAHLADLALVIEREPVSLATASVFLTRHREQFLLQVDQRKAVLKAQFEAIDTLDYQPSYEQAAEAVAAYLWSL